MKPETTNEKTEKRLLARPILLILLGLLVVIGAVTAIFLAGGRLSIVLKDPNEIIVVREEVCDGDKIDEYNEILSAESIDVDTLSEFSNQLLADAGESSDPNCLFMITQGLAFTGNTDEASSIYQNLVSIEESYGIYASGRINSLSSLQDLSIVADPEDFEPNDDGSW